MAKNNGLHEWFRENLWSFIIVAAGLIVTFSIFQQRVIALENKVEEYPSQDWFVLKFDNIDENFDGVYERFELLENKIDGKANRF